MIKGLLTRDRSGEFTIYPRSQMVQYNAEDGSWRLPYRPYDPSPFVIFFLRKSAWWELLPPRIQNDRTWGPKNWPRAVTFAGGEMLVGAHMPGMIYNRRFLKGVAQ